MRVNQATGETGLYQAINPATKELGIVTDKIALVPYEAHHVVKYHTWMQDPAIQEATASEPLTLEEEHDNQQSWRIAHDKLTFIICEPLAGSDTTPGSIRAKVDDANDRMVGDVNFFIYEDDDAQEDGPQDAKSNAALRGEVDVMIAHQDHRRQGYGSAAVQTLLLYLRQNIKDILAEYTRGAGIARDADMAGLMVKIKQGNAGSRRLFEKLGFKQKGDVNYFGEVTLLISWEEVETLVAGWLDSEESYRETAYEAK